MLGPDYDSDYPNDSQGYDVPSLPYVPYVPYATSSQSKESMAPVESDQDLPTFYAPDASMQQSSAEPYAEPTAWEPVAGQFTAPSPPVAEAMPMAPQKKSRRRLWITLISIVALLIIGSAATFALVSYINRSTPVKTLDTFCNALQKEDYQTAYNQFSKQLQGQFREGDFAGVISQDKVVSCTHGSASESGDHTSTSLKLVHSSKGVNNDTVLMTKGVDSIWKIDNLQKA